MSPFLAELLGTTILITLGDGVVTSVVLNRTKVTAAAGSSSRPAGRSPSPSRSTA
jgi:glycerol uptake facilitator-like aquaporin